MPTNPPAGRVLVPLDGSELAEATLPLLEHPQHPWGTEVVLLRPVTVDATTSPSVETEAGDYLATQARRLERCRSAGALRGVAPAIRPRQSSTPRRAGGWVSSP